MPPGQPKRTLAGKTFSQVPYSDFIYSTFIRPLTFECVYTHTHTVFVCVCMCVCVFQGCFVEPRWECKEVASVSINCGSRGNCFSKVLFMYYPEVVLYIYCKEVVRYIYCKEVASVYINCASRGNYMHVLYIYNTYPV
jgi:hypothetical protein